MNPLRKRFFKWVDRRTAPAQAFKLSHKNLYILPTRRGAGFLILILVLWLLGTNYQNNLILALVFLLLGVLHIAKLRTYFNLSGLQLRWRNVAPVHAGETALCKLAIATSRKAFAEAIEFGFQSKNGKQPELTTMSDIVPGKNNQITVPFKTEKRGVFKPGRMRVQSDFPLGFLRCWTWLNWDAEIIVLPHPIEIELLSEHGENRDASTTSHLREVSSASGDDFSGVRVYREGDSPRRVAWKNYARNEQLVTKTFDETLHQDIWLDFEYIASTNTEQRLSGLCYWALAYHKKNRTFGLRLPNMEIPPNQGERHLKTVLIALACYPNDTQHRFEGSRS